MEAELAAELTEIGRGICGEDGGDAMVVLSDRDGRSLVRYGNVVLKVHARGTDSAALAARLALAADPCLSEILLTPIPILPVDPPSNPFAARVGGRLVSAWPAGTPLSADAPDCGSDTRMRGPDRTPAARFCDGRCAAVVEDAPWEQAAALLARLHAAPVFGAVPPANVRRGLDRAMARLSDLQGDVLATEVRHAYATLPAWVPGWVPAGCAQPAQSVSLVHGDWHLGQLVRVDGRGWRIIDVDDLGSGDPAWDLARPAAWYAAGLLSPAAWDRFLGGYIAAGGRAVPAAGNPWELLDAPARALAVQYAANAVAEAALRCAPLDSIGQAFVDCCRRITASP